MTTIDELYDHAVDGCCKDDGISICTIDVDEWTDEVFSQKCVDCCGQCFKTKPCCELPEDLFNV